MRRVVYYGTCQMGALRNMHHRFAGPLTGDVVSWVDSNVPITKAGHTVIASADLIVCQVMGGATLADLAALPDAIPRHLVPVLGTTFLWPFCGQAHPKNRKNGPYLANVGDSFLNRMLKQGVPADEAVQRYVDLDVNSVVNLDRLMEVNIEQQRQRDALTDYRFSEIILEKFRDEFLYLSPYHMNVWLARLWVTEVFQRIEIDREAIEALDKGLTWAPFPATALPIHPSVLRHFGLSFVTETSRYRYPAMGNSVTFREYAERYMRFDWNETLDEGLGRAIAGQHQTALEKLRLGVEQVPGSVDGVRLLTERLARMDLHDEAIAVLRRAIAVDPTEPDFHSRLAMALLSVGDLAAAEGAGRHAIALSPDTDVFRRRLSGVLARQGRLAEAETEARTAVTLDPLTPDNYVLLGNLLTRSNQLDAAEGEMRRATSLAPTQPDPYRHLARVLQLQRKFDAAIDAVRAALHLMPTYAPDYNFLSTIQEEAGQTQGAEATLRRGIEILPRAPSVHLGLSRLLERLGRIDEAIAAAQCAVGLDAVDVNARLHLSNLLSGAGQTEAAEAVLREAILVAPQNARLLHGLGELLERHGKADAAIDAATHAAELGGMDAQGYLRLSELQLRAGRPAEAEATLHRAIAMLPNNTQLHHRMSFLLQDKGDMDGSLQSVVRALELEPERAEFHFRHSQMLTLRGEIEPAFQAIRRSVALNPSEPASHAHLGNLLAHAAQYDEAEAAFVQALTFAPDRRGIQEALASVRTLRARLRAPMAPAPALATEHNA